jgi:methionine-rich copper-binding protein CopC
MPVMPRRLRTVLRTAGRAAVVPAAALLLLGAGTPAALAHDQLVATVPQAGTTAPTAPTRVELQLDGAPQALGTQVVVTAPDGTAVSLGEPGLRGSTVVQPLPDGLAGGVYTVAWRVTSSDGHPLSGSYSFTVAADPAVAGHAAPVPPAPEPAAGAVIAAGVALLRLRRRA